MSDLRAVYCGTVSTLEPLTERGTAWMDEKLALEPWQFYGGAAVIDSRYIEDILDGAVEDGLELAQ